MKLLKMISLVVPVVVFATLPNLSFAAKKDIDGEIIAYMQAINNSEIAVSKIAATKDMDPKATEFANMMVDQHGENLKQVTDLSSTINVPADNTKKVDEFKAKSEKDADKLAKLDGKKFQIAYVKAMISGHTKVEGMLKKFEKEATNPELKNYLTATQKDVETHLADAKKLKS